MAMHEGKSFVLEAVGFGFKELVNHVRLFVFVLLAGTGLVAVVVGIIAFLNKGFIQSAMALNQEFQQCVGFECISAARESGASLMGLATGNFFSLLISGLILALFFIGLDLGFKKIALALHDRDEASVHDLVSCFKLAPKAIVAWALYCAMVWIGWLFFILPGFIALLRFAFFPYFIIDKNVGPIAALKMSYEVTKDHVWDIFAFWVAIKVIVYIGFLSWFGVILTWPLSTLAYAFFYRKLVADSRNREGFNQNFRAAV
jgi:uncharacterized membrane protein